MSAVLAGKVRNLPLGWRWTTMGDIAEVVGGGTPRTTEPANFEGGDIPWVTPADLSGYTEKYISHGSRYITRQGLESSSARLLPAGTVLFSSRAPIGYVAIACNPIATNQGFKSFLLKDGVSPEYVYWWLKGSKQLAESLASGTTFLEISGANAKKIPIPIAPLDQQRRIVAEIEKQFSRFNEAMAALKRTHTKLDRYRASLLTSACNGSLIGSDTKSWPQMTLGELVTIVQYGSSAKTSASKTGVPVLRMGNIVDGTLVLDELKYLPEDHDEFPALFLEPGDLLFNRTNSPELVGKSAVYQGQPVPCSFASYLIRLRFKPQILPEFVAYYLNSSLGRSWVKRVVSQQVGQANVNGSKLKALVIAVPPLELQRRIVAEVERSLSVAREVERQINANLIRADRMRQAVLAGAFSTKVDRETIRVRGSSDYA